MAATKHAGPEPINGLWVLVKGLQLRHFNSTEALAEHKVLHKGSIETKPTPESKQLGAGLGRHRQRQAFTVRSARRRYLRLESCRVPEGRPCTWRAAPCGAAVLPDSSLCSLKACRKRVVGTFRPKRKPLLIGRTDQKGFRGAPCRIRTGDPLFTRQVLWPTELRRRGPANRPRAVVAVVN